jgi:hypothetical protein
MLSHIALACGLWGQVTPSQEAPPLRYEGKPLLVPPRCTDEDITWAGLSCSEEEPCPIYLELTAVEAVGNKIFAIGNIHSTTVTLYSILLASDDAGTTWREAHDRIRGAGLEHLQFIDFETGWIGGQLLSPLPQDPFLLITNDGGKSWRQRNLFAESRFGSILHLWFSAKNSGSIVVDRGQGAEGSRYELYESPNAGETWMVRETSDRPIKLKRGPSGPSGWRIRADAASKSFRIEHQVQGDRWTAVASFLVPIGHCVPEPVKEVAAPSLDAAPAEPAAPSSIVVPRTPPTLKKTPR